MDGKILALAGGVGGAKLALGLARVVSPENLVICVNTGDDENFHGLHVSPDLDTVMYTLAGLSDQHSGWGLAGDTFIALGMLKQYGAETWFNLGDRDLATHIRRTQLIRQGANLSQVTSELCGRLGVNQQVVPMSNEPVRTVLDTEVGELAMQTYFVKHLAEPRVSRVRYVGSESAQASPGLDAALDQAALIVFCPSNPFLSLGPIIAVPGVRAKLESASVPRVAVSPIVGGAAVSGPAGKIMSEMGHEVSSVGVARQYQGLCDVLFIDEQDAHLGPAIEELGVKPVVSSIIMNSDAERVRLAQAVVAMGAS